LTSLSLDYINTTTKLSGV